MVAALRRFGSYKILGCYKAIYDGQSLVRGETWHKFRRVDGIGTHCVLAGSVDQEVEYWKTDESKTEIYLS